ncbi:MAG: helix-turn-helix domain-containing protein [Candidatus Omnitrophica bacterium]|nr:helix-turn-helix domain-containing protein [Candidatus Omnitrophota bacterium]
MNTIMTMDEVSEYLKTSKYTVYRMIKEKSIPASRVGGQWRFQRNQIDQWFSDQCITRFTRMHSEE